MPPPMPPPMAAALEDVDPLLFSEPLPGQSLALVTFAPPTHLRPWHAALQKLLVTPLLSCVQTPRRGGGEQ